MRIIGLAMNNLIWKLTTLLISFCFLLVSTGVFSQETETEEESAPPERNLAADTGYAALGIITSNIFLNLGARFGDQPYANTTFKSMKNNIVHWRWFWEDADRFMVNQFGHAYQGSTYFASARVNGFSFYESIVFLPLGSIMWEAFLEPDPSINDNISTTMGGTVMGEMLYRLFLEVDSSSSVLALIGGFLVNPISSFNKIYNRPPRATGGGNIYNLSVRSGVEKSFAFFSGSKEEENSWKYPGGHVNVKVVYGNPFVQHSKTPFEHFELYAGFTTNFDTYNAAVVSDGYLYSFSLVHTDTTSVSTGLNMHFDFFDVTNSVVDNAGYGNIQFCSSAVGWAVKHKYRLSEKSYLENKAHAAAILWGNSMYNADDESAMVWDTAFGNTRGTYGMGENIKLFFTFFHEKAGELEIAAHGYHVFAIPVNKRHSTGSVLFLNCSLSYDFPLGKIIGIGTKGTFWGLLGLYNSADNVNRYVVSNCLYVRFSF